MFPRILRQTREEFRAFREELRDIRTLVSKCDARLDKLENTVQTILESQEQYGSQGFKSEILKLEWSVNQLQADLNDRDQELLANDVELSGIPEESGENPTHLVLTVVTKLGIHMEEKELVNCMQVGMPARMPRLVRGPSLCSWRGATCVTTCCALRASAGF
ncbi:unnamed protein product [Parnassius apollo]|uniref:(apollo) hypothetical protein n=1 Tax=Parnassius apollo TaxID=110799 RepID=A0A8S3XGF9_PARAO|nr:unnamed protein product [Parnassius apollo]